MNILQLKDCVYTIGPHALLDCASIGIERGEHVIVLGRNGEGKSTLLKIIAAELSIDSGEIIFPQGTKISLLPQELPQGLTGSVFEVVVAGLGEVADVLAEYRQLVSQSCPQSLARLSQCQDKIESLDGWRLYQLVETVLSKMELEPNLQIDALSGGMRRRVLLASVLVSEPDILLLDEPTNHLDIEAILWLEQFLKNYQGTLVMVSHDRSFIGKVGDRYVELDRGKLYSYKGDYTNFLRRQEERLHAEQQANSLFDKQLAREEVWIRQGIKARRTRNEGRVRALKKMREQRSDRRNIVGQMRLQGVEGSNSGKKVIEAKDVCYAIDGKTIIDGFSTLIMRKDKIGIIGPNGCGKTTLLRLLLGELQPSSGSIKQGTGLEIAYFDQLRHQLDENLSVIDNVAGGRQEVTINGKSKHIYSYLQDFLFSPQRARLPITKLSGGERNRLLLAKLFTKPVNVLVMDEPTNDLDMESLELLESLIVDYQGTLLLVSHDRTFLNNVVTSLFVYQTDGLFVESVGSYDDYLSQQAARVKAVVEEKAAINVERSSAPRKKLSYNESRELADLPAKIEQLEQQLECMHTLMADSQFYQQTEKKITQTSQRLNELETQLKKAYQRWETLEELK